MVTICISLILVISVFIDQRHLKWKIAILLLLNNANFADFFIRFLGINYMLMNVSISSSYKFWVLNEKLI